VALLIGSTREEQAPWHYPFAPLTEEEVRDIAVGYLGPELTAIVQGLYPIADYESPLRMLITAETDLFSTCPTRNLALAAAASAPVYRYLYTHTFAHPAVDGFDLTPFHASHAHDEIFLWHGFDPWYSPTEGRSRWRTP
jgi:carboxylesterase type B